MEPARAGRLSFCAPRSHLPRHDHGCPMADRSSQTWWRARHASDDERESRARKRRLADNYVPADEATRRRLEACTHRPARRPNQPNEGTCRSLSHGRRGFGAWVDFSPTGQNGYHINGCAVLSQVAPRRVAVFCSWHPSIVPWPNTKPELACGSSFLRLSPLGIPPALPWHGDCYATSPTRKYFADQENGRSFRTTRRRRNPA